MPYLRRHRPILTSAAVRVDAVSHTERISGVRHRMVVLVVAGISAGCALSGAGTTTLRSRAYRRVVSAPVAMARTPLWALDACAAAWTASRVAAGISESLPDPPETFSDGLPAAIHV